MKRVAYASLSALTLHVARTLQDESVVPIRCELIVFRKALIDQERQLLSMGDEFRYIQGRILIRTTSGSHPVEHESAIHLSTVETSDSLSKMIGQIQDRHDELGVFSLF